MTLKQSGWLAAALAMGAIGIAAAQPPQTPATTSAKPNATEKAVIGKPFKEFALRDLTSDKGEMVKLSSFKGKKYVVGIFMANRCGTTWTYERKIGDFVKDYTPKDVTVFAVHANYMESDDEIKGQMEQRNLPLPILDDKATQSLAKYVGATCTPTFFIIDKAWTRCATSARSTSTDATLICARSWMRCLQASRFR